MPAQQVAGSPTHSSSQDTRLIISNWMNSTYPPASPVIRPAASISVGASVTAPAWESKNQSARLVASPAKNSRRMSRRLPEVDSAGGRSSAGGLVAAFQPVGSVGDARTTSERRYAGSACCCHQSGRGGTSPAYPA